MSEVPEGWTVVSLSELCRIELGNTPARADASLWDQQKETCNVWLSIADMPTGTSAVVEDSREYVSDIAARYTKLVPKGTLLVSFKLTLGRLCYAGRDLYTNEAIAALLDLNSSCILQAYLYWYLTYFDWNAAAEGDEKIKGKTLNKAKLSVLPVLVPPLDEQKRIVAVLDQAFAALDRARVNVETNLANLRGLQAQAIEDLLSGPQLGECETCGGHVDLLSGFAFKSAGYSDDPDDIRLVRGDNIVQGAFRWSGVMRWLASDRANYKKYELAKGDVLVAMDRTWVSAGIKYAVVDDDALPSLLVQRVARLRAKASLLPDYLAGWIGSPLFERYVLSIQTGLGVPHVSGGQIESFPMRVPSLKQQSIVISKLAQISQGCKKLSASYRRQIADLAALRQSLLQQAFSGAL